MSKPNPSPPTEPLVPYVRGSGLPPLPVGQAPIYDHMRYHATDDVPVVPAYPLALPLPNGEPATHWLGEAVELGDMLDPEDLIDLDATWEARFAATRT